LGAAGHLGAGGQGRPAKQALGRYNEHLQRGPQLHETWVHHKAETEQLKLSLRQLNRQDRRSQAEEEHPGVRAQRAEAQQRSGTMSGMSDKSAFESFERMAERSRATERKAIAAAELNEESLGDALARQFESLEYKGSSDQQLIELKARMGLLQAGSAQAKQLTAGLADVHDAEVIEDGTRGASH